MDETWISVSLSSSLSHAGIQGAQLLSSSSSSIGYAASEMLRGREVQSGVAMRLSCSPDCYIREPIFFFYPSPPPYPVHFSSFAGKWSGFLPPKEMEPRKVKE